MLNIIHKNITGIYENKKLIIVDPDESELNQEHMNQIQTIVNCLNHNEADKIKVKDGTTYIIYSEYRMQLIETEQDKIKETNKFVKGHYNLKEVGVI